MPKVEAAQIYVPDAIAALNRALKAWNMTQLEVEITSAEAFISAVRAAMDNGRAT